MARAGDWVQIHSVVLTADQRTGKLPEDTRGVPFEAWSKGHLVSPDEARLGDEVQVRTVTGRLLHGTLLAVDPGYGHGFGDAHIPELAAVAAQARAILRAPAGSVSSGRPDGGSLS